MRLRDKLRSLRAKLRARRQSARPNPQSPPSPASQSPASHSAATFPPDASASASPGSSQAQKSSASPAPVPASSDESQGPSQNPTPHSSTPAPASSLFPFMHLVEHPDAAKRAAPLLAYLSLSSDLRILHAASRPTKPSSIIDFRHPDCCLELKRLPQQTSTPTQSLHASIAPRVHPEDHATGPAVRVTDERRSILLIAASEEEERDALLSALCMRVAPWNILRAHMEAEMRDAASAPSASGPSLADVAGEFVSGAAGAADGVPGSASEEKEKGAAGLAKLVWEKAATVAQMSLWASTFGQGLRDGGAVRSAGVLEKLAMPLGRLAVVGCAFSLVALLARAVSLTGMELDGRDALAQARDDLREASVSLVGWLFSILSSGFSDEDGLVGNVFDVLKECWDRANELEQYLLRTWVIRAWKAEDIGIIVAKVDSVTGKLLATGLLNVVAKHNRRIVDLEDKAFVVDEFRPYAPAPFDFSVGLVENVATSLAQLKGAVLRTDSAEGSDLYEAGSGSSLCRVALTSINGEGGVGKTSTCKLLCVDQEVRARFSEGAILWIDVGKDATEEKVKGELGSAVLLCGGTQSAESMRSLCDVKAAVDIARLFFSRHRVLVIADNVWETPAGSGVTSWAETLSKIASYQGSAVIVTTRFISLSRSPRFNRVKLGRLDLSADESPDWSIAEGLYDALLKEETKVPSSDEYKKSRRRALKLSCGLPLGIATFSGLVQSYWEMGDDVETVLSDIEQRVLGLADKVVGEDVKASTGHPGLFAAMDESLSYLDQRERIDCRVESVPLSVREDVEGNTVRAFRSSYNSFAGQSLSSRYAALEVMLASSTSISFPLLCHLWHVPSVADVKSIARLFVNMGLGRIEGGEEKTFNLHDLQYAFCASSCKRPTGATSGADAPSLGTVNGHALLLSSCESLLGSEKAGDNGVVAWAKFCFGDAPVLSEAFLRNYLCHNLFRHLCAAAAGADADGVRRTMMSVLADFRWLRGRIAGDGRSSAVLDCANALASRAHVSASTSIETRLLTGGAEKSIRALQQSLMLVGEGMSVESDGTLAGSLIQLFQSSGSGEAGHDATFLSHLACSSEREVRGAWVKPIQGCSRARDKGVLSQAVVGSGSLVRSLTALGDGTHFVSGSVDGVVRVHEIDFLGAVLELKGNASEVNCVDAGKKDEMEGSFLLFSGSHDGIVRCWEVQQDPVKGIVESTSASAIVGDCQSRVRCLSVSKGGDLVAAGCQNGLVYIWKHQYGDAALCFEFITSFRCSLAENESGWAHGVVVSRSGDLVVAAEEKGGVAFWSCGGCGMEETVDRYCASDGSGAKLQHVLLSENESSVSFVFNEPAGCEIWDVASRRQRSARVALSDFKVLTCAIFSRGEDAYVEGSGSFGVLVAGGLNGSGKDFISVLAENSASNGIKVLSKHPLASAPRSICCTSFGGDTRIFVGSQDGCVRMLGAGVPVAKDDATPYEEDVGSLVSATGSIYASNLPELEEVSTVAVMPTAGYILAGHFDGRFSLWRAESGDFVRAFECKIGDWVNCIDISTDERLAVSGHWNGVSLVWDTSKWECRFVLVEFLAKPVRFARGADSAEGKDRLVALSLDSSCNGTGARGP